MNKTAIDTAMMLLPFGRLAIDPVWGWQQFRMHVWDMMQVQMGATDMGYAERRAASKVVVVKAGDIVSDASFETIGVRNGFSSEKIAIVNINGMIRNEDGQCSYGMMTMADQLMKVRNEVTGAIFNISSGGGYADGGETMVAAIREFGKPTVTLSQYAGSAAYMIAAQTDVVFAKTEMSQFGSIGTFISLDKEMKELIKNSMEVIYAETSPDKNAAARAWMDNDDISGFVKMANDHDKFFMAHVKNARELKGEPDTIKQTLAGGMFFAKDAIKRGMVDAIGDNARAINQIQLLSK